MSAQWLRAAHRTVAVVVALFLFAIIALPLQQYMFYFRAKRLLADMQIIELHKSTWADVQRLMSRWGRYGNYSGTCTAESCRYSIKVGEPYGTLYDWLSLHYSQATLDRIPLAGIRHLFSLLGDNGAVLIGKFIVQDGLIVRSGLYALVDVPSRTAEDSEYSLLVSAYSVNRVAQPADLEDRRISPLAEHPLYSAMMPGGCEVCMAAWIDYSQAAPAALARQLNAINVDCFRPGARCTTVEDLLPATAPFKFYGGELGKHPLDPSLGKEGHRVLGTCDLPIWIRTRDAERIVAARALTEKSGNGSGFAETQNQVKVSTWLKGTGAAPGTTLTVVPWTGFNPEAGPKERIGIGQDVILMDYDSPPYWTHGLDPVALDRCSVLPDTPENRTQIQKGLALNDTLRGPEFRSSIWTF